MKKFILFVFALILLLQIPMTVSAKNYNWYFRSAPDHKQPVVFDNNKMPEKYGSLFIGSPDEKVIYLTFDAGYASDGLVKILDTLKEESVSAAFFILPAIPEKNPDLAKRMAAEGHIVANHTRSHRNMANITDKAEFLKELTDMEDIYYNCTGSKLSKYYRPPEGSFSEENLMICKEYGYIPTFWSFAYADWDNNAQKDHAWAKKKILDNVHNGMVMLLHPNSSTNAAILGDIIKELKAQGYRFGTLDELKAYSESKNANPN
jgi:peptidoglycan-N-acetylmuramic acid deacetylase